MKFTKPENLKHFLFGKEYTPLEIEHAYDIPVTIPNIVIISASLALFVPVAIFLSIAGEDFITK